MEILITIKADKDDLTALSTEKICRKSPFKVV